MGRYIFTIFLHYSQHFYKQYFNIQQVIFSALIEHIPLEQGLRLL